ncbi:MAG: GntR family transcriptional regulator [Chloroflexi bacterium]|nr:GntR family transcriptional regulator [Chloroflexota bacterium]
MTEENKSYESPFVRLQRELGVMIANAQPGEKFLTEPELARELKVSRSTLREAMRSFETQGFLIRKQGSGTFKADSTSVFETGLEVLESMETLADRLGLDISMGSLEISHVPSDQKMSDILNIRKGASLVCVSRVICVKGQPAAYLQDNLPEKLLSSKELENGFTGSVLDLLITRGDPPLEQSNAEVKVIPAPHEVARALDIQRGEALLMFEANLLAQGGRVIDHSYSWFLPGFFRFHVNRKIGLI